MNKNEQIKKLFSKKVLCLAPMAGYTDIGFRYLCKKYGADLVFTEMISAKAICHNSKRTFDMMQITEFEKPVVLQLFGHNPEDFKQALLNEHTFKFDFIDINMGCPAPKIFKNGDGSALLEDINTAKSIIEAVVSSTDKPVSVKFRSGVTEDKIIAVEFAKMCEQAGVSFITIHPRTRSQGYAGKSDWEIVKDVVNAVNIPVVASGDCLTYFDFKYLTENCGASGVMIGRGAMGKPEIFWQIKNCTMDGVSNQEKKEQILTHISILSNHFNEKFVSATIKKHLACYLKQLKVSSATIVEAMKLDSVAEIVEFIQNIKI